MTGNTTLEDNPLDAPAFDINGQVGQKTCGKGVGARSRMDAIDQPSGTVVSATNRQVRRPLERERGRLAQTPYSDSAQTPTTGCLVSSMCITAHSLDRGPYYTMSSTSESTACMDTTGESSGHTNRVCARWTGPDCPRPPGEPLPHGRG